jgi:hypothetical protein
VSSSESITVLCTDKAPIDVVLTGIGKLGFTSECRGYSKIALLQTHIAINSSEYENDLMSKANIDFDCCEELGMKFNISSIHLNTSFKHIVSHLDDLNITSLRVSEVEKMIKEQEWRRLHTVSQNKYSVLVYICLTLIGMYATYEVYNCLKGRVGCTRAISDANGSGGNVVNIKIHTSNESVAISNEDIPLRELNSPTPEHKVRRSSRLRTSKSCF